MEASKYTQDTRSLPTVFLHFSPAVGRMLLLRHRDYAQRLGFNYQCLFLALPGPLSGATYNISTVRIG